MPNDFILKLIINCNNEGNFIDKQYCISIIQFKIFLAKFNLIMKSLFFNFPINRKCLGLAKPTTYDI